MGTPVIPPAVELRSVSKHFGGVEALRNVSFAAARGEIHAIVGENGAGKSTLIKILAGVHKPDVGQVFRDGIEIDVDSPAAARRAGITVVHQELTLLPDLTVAENIMAGSLPVTRFGVVDRRAVDRQVSAVLAQLDLSIAPQQRVDDLSLPQQQMVEIARGLAMGGEILILDEPNSALGATETEILLATIRRLAVDGKTIILISHRLGEIFSVCDRVTVLRDGQTQGTWTVKETDIPEIVRTMVGDVQFPPEIERIAPMEESLVLSLHEVTAVGVGPVDLAIHRGEIVGLVGLEGSGIDTILRIAGGAIRSRGRIEIDGEPTRVRTPLDAIRAGVVYLPPDRKIEGLWLDYSIERNIASGNLDEVTSLGIIRPGRVRAQAAQWTQRLGMKVRDPRVIVGRLSGGNQQRVLLGRCLAARPKVLLLSDPTRGVDVFAKAEIHALIRELAADGMAICLASSEFDQVLDLADRVVCMHKGLAISQGPAHQFTKAALLEQIGAAA